MEQTPTVDEAPVRLRGTWRRRSRWLLLIPALALLGLIATMIWLDSESGHRYLARQIAVFKQESGLCLRVGRISGSIYSDAVLHDVSLCDADGIFFTAERAELDWYPFSYPVGRLTIDRLDVQRSTLLRVPRFNQTDRDGPILPDFDIFIGELTARDMVIAEAVAGREQRANLVANADIRDERARVRLAASSGASGDRIQLDADVEPDADRFDLMADLAAPEGGVLAALTGIERGFMLDLSGEGRWARWKGRLLATSGGASLADLSLGARDGYYTANGVVEADLLLSGVAARLAAPRLMVNLGGRFEDRIVSGRGELRSRAAALDLDGGYDLAEGGFDALKLGIRLYDPAALSSDFAAEGLAGTVSLNGPPSSLRFDYRLAATRFAIGKAVLTPLTIAGEGKLENGRGRLPLTLTADRVTGLGPLADKLASNVVLDGVLSIDGDRLTGRDLAFRTRQIKALVDIDADFARATYSIDARGGIDGFVIDKLGTADLRAKVNIRPGGGGKLLTVGTLDARMRRMENRFLLELGGGLPTLKTQFTRGADKLFRFSDFVIAAPDLRFAGDGVRNEDGTYDIDGLGRHVRWGAFDMALVGRLERPRIELDLESPFDPAGLRNVRLLLDPGETGFAYEAAGGSTLGRFTSVGTILLPRGGDAVIDIDRLTVGQTVARGRVKPVAGGLTGTLAIAGGGVDGQLQLRAENGGQRVIGDLGVRNARFESAQNLLVRTADADIDAFFIEGRSTIDATVRAQGISQGSFVLGRLEAQARIENGTGRVTASLAGTRGSRFAFDTSAAVTPNRISIAGKGAFRRQPIRLANRAVLRRTGGGWRLAPATLSYGGGNVRAAGTFGGGRTTLDLRMNDMPLGILDLVNSELGLGGRATGTLDYADGAGPPTGNAKLRIKGLSRAGLLLTSSPLDLGLNAALGANSAALRAIVQNKGQTIGRVQGRVSGMTAGGGLADRIGRAPVFAQARFSGEAGTLWRLTGFELFDLTGPVRLGADIRGSLADPVIQGVVSTQNVRLESGVSGTLVTGIAARGRFDGSRLRLSEIRGKAGRGTISGSGSFDFSAARGVGVDLDFQADNAELLDRDDIGATMTGPLNVRSDGAGGTISGKVVLNRSRFVLGNADPREQLPDLAVREINRPGDAPFARERVRPWRLAIDARVPSGLEVTGLGLDSEWRGDLAIRGLVTDPVLTGQAELIRGDYEFAGRDFRLSRGFIRFVGESPPDPALDIVAVADVSDVDATINVGGTGQRPEIRFTSVPSLPEEELLARLLFGSSITNLSAPEALQLASAVAGLRGGGGLDPINAVRRAAGLDRLRILPADVETGQGTSIAAGKYVTRRTYVELVTDGRGYSATRVEFQITRWLSLLSSISTIGRQSVNARVSKDY